MYLSQDHLIQALIRGRNGVEQWLGPINDGGESLLKWVWLGKEPEPVSTYSVVLIEVYDEGGAVLEELSPLDVDEPEGKISSFETKEEALDYAVNELGCSLDRFVRAGEVQQEYEKYLDERGSL